jgi:hypothetical protein
MANLRWLLTPLLGLAGMGALGGPGEARAQITFTSSNGFGTVGVVRGTGRHHRHHHSVSGLTRGAYRLGSHGLGYYVPAIYGPYGVVTVSRTIVVPPPTIIVNSRPRDMDEDDVSGIDLDEIDPRTMRPRKEILERREGLERLPPPMVPRLERPPEEKRPIKPPPPFQPVPKDAAEDLKPLEAGQKAFANREYGLAAQHFQLAILAEPGSALPHFLLAQAQLALGKHRDAVRAIHAGMDLDEDWPAARFASRELYGANEIDFLGHLKRLEDLLENQPDDAGLLFLLGYELWFDGQRAKARALFEKAKKHAADPAYVNEFLKT